MQKVSEKVVSNNSNVKAAILEQNGDGPIFQNDVAAVYPYLSSDNSVVSLIAFKEGSDTMRLLGRWQLDVNDDKYVISAEYGGVFGFRRPDYWIPDDTIQIHDKMMSWLNAA